jgi:hypothetical protein
VRPRRHGALLCGPSTSPLEGEALAQLVYETTDPDFADRALTAMRKHNIPCYRVGHGYSNKSAELGNFGRALTENQICIYIERDADYAAANRVLIDVGAVVDKPIPKWVFAAFAALAAIVSIWLAVELNK